MEPPHVRGGMDYLVPKGDYLVVPLQWSRRMFAAECDLRKSCPTTLATLQWSRRMFAAECYTEAQGAARAMCFNGAAACSRRNVLCWQCEVAFELKLQWSRRMFAAE